MDDKFPSDEQNVFIKWILTFVSENETSSFLILFGIVVCLIGVFGLLNSKNNQTEGIEILTDENQTDSYSKNKKSIIVEVSGEVINPGVYELSQDQRIIDALDKAGGFTEYADLAYVGKTINKASKLVDGQKIYIPHVSNQSDVLSANIVDDNTSGQSISSSLVNINTDSAQKLDSLPGIGQTYAQKIIDQRPYSSLDDLKNKKVIPESLFEKIKDKITLY